MISVPRNLTWFLSVAMIGLCVASPRSASAQVNGPALTDGVGLNDVNRQAAAAPDTAASTRPKVGVALGGGSARGIAHVGVLRWLEEHHIPVDVLAGTSMGGLIGGTFATGMSPDEIETMLSGVDWDATFGSSNFRYKNIRRKADSRAYPSNLEFGLKQGISAPTSLNSGQQVELLIGRITATSYALTFDELPTPFRAVAMDLRTAKFIVLDHGPLARAMRATMSLPLIFPPVEFEGHVLVDGGAMNNIPADVARSMGATKVIAVNVGDLKDLTTVNYSMLALGSQTLDGMMRANSLKALKEADVVIDVPLSAFGSLDWRRYKALIAEGYKAAEAAKDRLLPLAVDDATWQAWVTERAARRRNALPVPTAISVEGGSEKDVHEMEKVLARYVGKPLDVAALDADLTMLGGLDRYQTLTWDVVHAPEGDRLVVHAVEKKYGPPFVYLGLTVENTTANDLRFNFGGRYLAFDVLGSGSELRLDATVGSDPSVGATLYRPLGNTPFFVEPFAVVDRHTLNLIKDDHIVASYGQTRIAAGMDAGVNIGRVDDIRLRALFGRFDANVLVGDPGLPDLSGQESVVALQWGHDGQDSPVVPTHGVHSVASVQYFAKAPQPAPPFETTRSTEGVTQAELKGSSFWPVGHHGVGRVFLSGGAGTSFDGRPLAPDQFALGGPFRLGAYNTGERLGDHYVLATGGYLRSVARLPDFLGGPIYVGGWLENGSAFDHWDDAKFSTQASLGLIVQTLLGPAFVGTSIGFDGRYRMYFGFGRLFN